MPAKSAKQERFMQAVANNPKFAKKVGVPVTVGQEFTKSGGGMATKMNPGFMAMMKKKAPAKKMAMGGYADGGMPMVMKDGKKVPSFAADGKGKMKHGGMAVKKMASGGMTSMGKVKTAAPSKDGVAQQGKTKGKQVVMAGNKRMNKGGRTC
jgi:hypothetical protein